MNAPAIETHALSKRYVIGERSLAGRLLPGRQKPRTLWANRDIDLRIEKGETVGMLGRNGAGKSTLLRMLAGVSEPSSGSLTVRGRIAPLISVGVGFHKELTGRENVYVNGMLLGLTRAEIDERFDQIVDFAELEHRIDSQVKFYSSGMFMRLGFSVAVHVDPQVLLVDEVLAVGDLAFQAKCFDRMRYLVEHGTTVVLVSHSVMAIQLLCPRTLVFSDGEMIYDGDTLGAIDLHQQVLAAQEAERQGDTAPGAADDVSVEAALTGPAGPISVTSPTTPLRLDAQVTFHREVVNPHFAFQVLDETGAVNFQFHTPTNHEFRTFAAGETETVSVRFTPTVGGGAKRLRLAVFDRSATTKHGQSPAVPLYVEPRMGNSGPAYAEAELSVGDVVLEQSSLLLGRDTSTS